MFAMISALVLLTSCTRGPEETGITVFDDMVNSPAYEAYSENELAPDGRTMMDPVKGTIARGKMPHEFTKSEEDAIRAGQVLQDPFSETSASLERGKYLYGAFCSSCHGLTGEGDGPVVSKKFPAPPAIRSRRVKEFSKGRIYHVITAGFGDMPGHEAQLTIRDRWFLSQYIKQMQK